MSQAVYVVYNLNSGLSNSLEDIKKILTELRINARYIPFQDFLRDGLAKEVKKSGRLIVAAGGDGTISAVASQLIDENAVLGVLPCGTLNHFAKDLEIPLDLKAAAQILLNGRVTKVDVGTVNDRVFINNSSIGLYPQLVKSREEYAPKLGKPLAHLVSTIVAIVRLRLYDIDMEVNGKSLKRQTPFIFVGNNPYGLKKFGFTNRQTLSSGKLCLYLVKAHRRWHTIWLFTLAVLGIASRTSSFEVHTLPQVNLNSPQKTIAVAIDGEITKLSSPLKYKISPKSLRIRLPK